MPRRLPPTAAVALLTGVVLTAGVALGGCATVHDSTGRVSVTVSDDAAPDHRYEIEVHDENDQLVEHQSMLAGQHADFAGVPLGKVTVSASGLCSVHTKVTYQDVTTVRLGTSHCS